MTEFVYLQIICCRFGFDLFLLSFESGIADPGVGFGTLLAGLQVARSVTELSIAHRWPGTGLAVVVVALERRK